MTVTDTPLHSLVTGLSVDGQPLQLEDEQVTNTDSVAFVIKLPDAQDPNNEELDVAFRGTFTELNGEAELLGRKLVLAWEMIYPSTLQTLRPEGNLRLFQTLNRLNSEIGAKFRLESSEGQSWILLETELGLDERNAPAMQRAFDASLNSLASHYDTILDAATQA